MPAYAKSIRKQQRQAPKFYFSDLGVKKSLQKTLDIQLTPRTSEWGYAFKHFIICEFIRLNDYLDKDYMFSYFSTKDNFEVDLVVEKHGKKPIFIEIKSSDKIFSEDFSSFASFVAERKSPGYVLSCDPSARIENGVKYLPWQQGIKEIFE